MFQSAYCLSLLPGGIAIREFVIVTLLGAPFGDGAAMISAILLRLLWLLSELLLAALLYLAKPKPPQAEAAATCAV